MREAGDVCYADVYKDGTGVVEFLRYDDMKYAARKLDNTKFRSHEVTLSDDIIYSKPSELIDNIWDQRIARLNTRLVFERLFQLFRIL